MNGVKEYLGTESGQIQIMVENDPSETSKITFKGKAEFEESVFYPLSPVQMTLYYSFLSEVVIS